jgi:hypothetical protein
MEKNRIVLFLSRVKIMLHSFGALERDLLSV